MPRISVFTPSHNTRWLDECYESLQNQTFRDWEWIILLNGWATGDWEPPKDPRVHTHSAPNVKNIGALKAEAIRHAAGEILVELDHDDRLTPDALAEIANSVATHPTATLIYSDCAQIDEHGHRELSTFDGRHGWEYAPVRIEGQELLSVKALEPSPHNVSLIWYAPNHVRAIPRWAYDAVGGYRPDLSVLDDQDLMHRLYLIGPFHHIQHVLYLQRVHEGNSQSDPERNQQIQVITVQMYEDTIDANVQAWADRAGLAKLDLGGAHNPMPGYTPVDLAPNHDPHRADYIEAEAVNYLANVDAGSVGVIRAHDFLEHVPEAVTLMNLIHRALAPDGMLLSQTPSTDGRGAFQDPTHVSFWNENSFDYYTDPVIAKYVPEIAGRFQASRVVTHYPSPWHQEKQIAYVEANLIALHPGGVRNGGFLHW